MSPTSPRQPGGGGGARLQAASAAAFRVHRDSHTIHKAPSPPPSSSSTNSSVSSSSNAATTNTNSSNRPAPAPRQRQPPPPQQHQQPVIIYTHSPKVIRTNPRDFMSIVQKLTGLDSPAGAAPAPRVNAGSPSFLAAVQDESSTSSSESCANAHAHAHAPPPPRYADPQLMPPPPAAAAPMDAHFMAPDMPLFAPGAPDLQFCAPRGLYGQFPPFDAAAAAAALGPMMSTNMNGAGGNGGAVFSPSMVEPMRSFPDY
ncbi:hypothetical protein ACP4OV_003930 [Aristida adscensionis]